MLLQPGEIKLQLSEVEFVNSQKFPFIYFDFFYIHTLRRFVGVACILSVFLRKCGPSFNRVLSPKLQLLVFINRLSLQKAET